MTSSALERFSIKCEQEGMIVNTAKTEVMVVAWEPIECSIQLGGATLRQVDQFKYLGVIFTGYGRQDAFPLWETRGYA